MFSLLNIMKGPLTFNLRSVALKKKDKIPQQTMKTRKEGDKLGKEHQDLLINKSLLLFR